MRWSLLLLAGCGSLFGGRDTDSAPCEWTAEPREPDGVLASWRNDCGVWIVAPGDHLILDVFLDDPEAPCAEVLDEGVELMSSPIYSNFEPDGPKWTYDFVVDEAFEGTAELSVTCEDGTEWWGRITTP